MEEEELAERRRRPCGRLAALGLLLLLFLAVLLAWIQRRQIAADFIDRELARRGVQASYQVKRIGFRTQRLENLVIGDPRRPDLTARSVEIEVSLGVRRPRVSLITARGVRLFGRLEKGRVRLGQVDRLLPPPSGRPFRLPNQRIDIADAGLALDTPAGRIGIGIAGSGNLAYSFEGRIAAVARGLVLDGSCRLDAPVLHGAIRTEEERPHFRGPVRAAAVGCAGFDLAQPQFTVDAVLAPALDRTRGSAALRIARLRTGGQAVRNLSGRVAFDAGAEQVRGDMALSADGIAAGAYRAGRTSLDGRYAFAPKSGAVSVLAYLAASGVTGGQGTLAAVARAFGGAGGTPVAPVADALAAAVRRMGRAFDARASVRVVKAPGYGAARVERLRVDGRSGARLRLVGRKGFTHYWPSGSVRLDTEVALGGGGFPAARLSLRQARPGALLRGTARVAPMAARGGRLALTEIRFTARDGRTHVETIATIDGPIPDGRVEGLVLPVDGGFGGGFAFGERCTPARFRLLRTSALRLGPARFTLCPVGRGLLWRGPGGGVRGGARIAAPRLAGTLGGTPLTVGGGSLGFDLARRSFAGTDVAIRLGRAGGVSRLDLAALDGRFGARGIAGRFAGGEGGIAHVPLRIGAARGEWSLAGGRLSLAGGMTVSDEADPSRFHPLATDDFRLTLAGGRIAANGTLKDPETGTLVTRATIAHSLAEGRGGAVLDVPGIRFDKDYQPEELTRLTTGVVALVNGTVTGRGEIGWGPEGVRSTGTFSTEKMSLAAAFGPVEGLSTTIRFDDLLGLRTAPGQVATVDLVRTGIDVFDGMIRYQLLPDMRVRVEGGRWPFAGGALILEETILDFSRPSTKRLVFRVSGLDAARFVQQMEFSNITATGTFDGVIPMEFDARGGRIVGGRLVARPEGGTLSYIGELTDRQLGVYGKLAFDALKSLRYNKLTIDLNGDLAGEFVAGIELDGIARDPQLTTVGAGGGISGLVARRALGQLAKIPFEFNISVRGPFRALIATARSFEDPSNLIQSVLPPELRDMPAATTVQPQESETMR